jgi:hypothetical protein
VNYSLLPLVLDLIRGGQSLIFFRMLSLDNLFSSFRFFVLIRCPFTFFTRLSVGYYFRFEPGDLLSASDLNLHVLPLHQGLYRAGFHPRQALAVYVELACDGVPGLVFMEVGVDLRLNG